MWLISSKFFMKRPSLFSIKKCLVWRLSDFSSVTNLPGIYVPEPKYYFKFQKFTSNDEEREVKLHDGYKINPPKNCVNFLEFQIFFTPILGGHNFDLRKQILNCLTDSENLQPKPLMNVI